MFFNLSGVAVTAELTWHFLISGHGGRTVCVESYCVVTIHDYKHWQYAACFQGRIFFYGLLLSFSLVISCFSRVSARKSRKC